MNSPKKAPKVDRAKTVLVRELIATQVKYLGTGAGQIAEALGYANKNVLSMLKSGAMKLPLDKLAIAASVLKLDKVFLTRCWSAEANIDVISIVEDLAERPAITANEASLILTLREVSRGMDVDMAQHGDQLNAMLRAYGEAATKERGQFNATLTSLANRRKGSAISKGQEDLKSA